MTTSTADFLSTRETAVQLGLSPTTIQLWVEAGKLPAWKTKGGHRRIPREAVDRLLAEQRGMLIDDPTRTPVVLVVEDDPVQRALYVEKFTSWKLPVELVTAEDGYMGLIAVGRHDPDLLIADLDMPEMNGFEMIKRILDNPYQKRHTRILVVSALSREQIDAAGGLPESIPVYPKPIPFVALKTLLSRQFKPKSVLG
jgi:excisionase family DNA binding protein